ncbi:MAG TPA: DNA (cytosine-5-)-methyltransferase [Lentisphaeria bacterium]|nr:MAG: hypothetical protein A2X45_14575 [Lentisphaerae bacterium GWF2_50_93]HCE45522.1 DNA (cytosine-5-)-methyltransferase [Lentisphaeria bacterium]
MSLPTTYKLAELFCGPGGLATGALLSNIEINGTIHTIQPAWANDIDEDTCKTYAANIKHAQLSEVGSSVVCGDVTKITSFRKIKFDALAFGFPCNDFSAVGETKGFEGKYGPLYTHGVRAIDSQNPYWFLAENVGGLRNANEGKAFETILHDMEHCGKHGYFLTAHLYRFEEYGVPQARHRIIIVGIRNDLGVRYKVPAPITSELKKQTSCKKAIETPPISPDASNNERTKQSKTVEDRLMCIPPGENAWFLDKVLALSDADLTKTMLRIDTFKQHFPSAKTSESIRRIIKDIRLNVKSARMSQIYKRLNPSKPSYTITGSGGGGTHVYHWSDPRALTNRERARLQTFDDSFIFIGNKESVRKQIGMAVPPQGAKHIFKAILMTLAGIKYKTVKANLYETGLKPIELTAILNDKEE